MNLILTLFISLALPVFSFASDVKNSITTIEANTLIQNNQAILVDIREASEIASGMAAPAVWYAKSNIDSNEQQFADFLNLNKDKTIILYCRSGRRASVIVDRMQARGFLLYNMGGYQDWLNAGLPVKTP